MEKGSTSGSVSVSVEIEMENNLNEEQQQVRVHHPTTIVHVEEEEDEETEINGCCCWDEMIPDALGLIFKNLSLEELLLVVPSVCKSWRKAVYGPYCWEEIDLVDWHFHYSYDDDVKYERLIKMLLSWSSSTVKKLALDHLLGDGALCMISEHASSLEDLAIPQSPVTDATFRKLADRFQSLTHLDVSYCERMGAEALRAIGLNCKSLMSLKRTMHPQGVYVVGCQDAEACAIAETMPHLKILDMGYVHLTNKGVGALVSGCTELELLDLRGCFEVNLEEADWPRETSEKGLKILSPLVDDDTYLDGGTDYDSYSSEDNEEFGYDTASEYEGGWHSEDSYGDGDYDVWDGSMGVGP